MSEILGQLEEEKILRSDNPQSRTNSIKLIKMLGDSVGAFTTNINVSEVNPEDSLQVLIEMDVVEKEVKEGALAGFQLASNTEHEREQTGHDVGKIVAFGGRILHKQEKCTMP